MKKALAILLLIVGGAAFIALIAWLTTWAFIILSVLVPENGAWVLITLAVMFLFIVSYPFGFLRENLKKKFRINPAVFVVCFCAPSLIAGVAANLLYTPVVNDGTKYIPVGVWLIFWLIITAVFTFWMIVHACVAEYKIHRDKNA